MLLRRKKGGSRSGIGRGREEVRECGGKREIDRERDSVRERERERERERDCFEL